MDYICNECQTRYGSGPYDNVPSGIKWSDGHTCDPVPVEFEMQAHCSNCNDMDLHLDEQCADCGRTQHSM